MPVHAGLHSRRFRQRRQQVEEGKADAEVADALRQFASIGLGLARRADDEVAEDVDPVFLAQAAESLDIACGGWPS